MEVNLSDLLKILVRWIRDWADSIRAAWPRTRTRTGSVIQCLPKNSPTVIHMVAAVVRSIPTRLVSYTMRRRNLGIIYRMIRESVRYWMPRGILKIFWTIYLHRVRPWSLRRIWCGCSSCRAIRGVFVPSRYLFISRLYTPLTKFDNMKEIQNSIYYMILQSNLYSPLIWCPELYSI